MNYNFFFKFTQNPIPAAPCPSRRIIQRAPILISHHHQVGHLDKKAVVHHARDRIDLVVEYVAGSPMLPKEQSRI